MEKVRFGIIGVGNMGNAHVDNFLSGKIKNGVITAVCDVDEKKLATAKEKLGDDVFFTTNDDELINCGKIDVLFVVTPHYSHTELAIKGFEAGLHVLCEKPAGVYTKQVREMNEAAKKSGKLFGMMYNQRTNPVYQKVRELIKSGELGEITRVNWIITDWFRTQSYYDSGSWRATWAGEGGGVLLNQDPHQIDLLQWLCGMPAKVTAFCSYGKFHNIEVEDDVTAYFEYPNGATGVFVTSTGDAPGTNRLEISGDLGKIVIENEKLQYIRNTEPTSEVLKNSPDGFKAPERWNVEVPVAAGTGTQHVGICNNFINAVLLGTELLAPGEEGLNGLTISNAIHLSSWTGATVTLPLDEDMFITLLQERIKTSKFVKPEVTAGVLELEGTFGF